MEHGMNYKLIAVIIIILTWLYGMLLELLSRRSANNPIPENVADVYDPETYKRWREYHAEKGRLSFISQTASLIISLALILSDAYPASARLFPKTDFLQMLAVFLLSTIDQGFHAEGAVAAVADAVHDEILHDF